MDFAKIISNYLEIVFQKYVAFEGRAGRPEFWYFMLVNVKRDKGESAEAMALSYTLTFDDSVDHLYRLNRETGDVDRYYPLNEEGQKEYAEWLKTEEIDNPAE